MKKLARVKTCKVFCVATYVKCYSNLMFVIKLVKQTIVCNIWT